MQDTQIVEISFVDDKAVGQMADERLVRDELVPVRMKGSIGPRDPVTGVRVHALTVIARRDS